ncbi:MAG TPA: glycosyltransferase family 2 protein [Kiritimatiellia bacterium]|nr:glycosyltransferase family 2 protein [Kiritimatiellia bacterium]HNS81736.1 glycosyltransferase family 2 protein [Kiritimatiellia bacterium]HPA78307.1 glycosyltransferase family 2 protein [Kiritimatiellia bacterium]HQQ04731.1 glycosyltransferase family 2 protein [Kiritimatiellia bacterium]
MNPLPFKPRYCVLIPAYQEEKNIASVVRDALKYCPQVIVVDDGSGDKTASVADQAGAIVHRHETNRGKGAALQTGFAVARARECDAVITMDADGQHKPEEIPRFMDAYERTRIPVLVGNRMADPAGMPLIRRLTNRFMSCMLSRVMKQYVPDTQCGFRLFASDLTPFVPTESAGFAAESEILLYVARRGIRMDSVRVSTVYTGAEQSSIRPFSDAFRFFGMLWRNRERKRF